ncbi:MAG: M56 family metallopeptidase [Candidatus Bathyarchaeota archaeon]|nr:M56 family metallopeptidase [Candidatus Bathyarchaeota archaeon]
MPENGVIQTAEYSIDTEVSEGNLKFLPEFLKRNYLLQQNKYRDFRNINTATQNGKQFLTYNVTAPKTQQQIQVNVEASAPVKVTMTFDDSSIQKTFLDQLYDDLFLMVQLYEEEIRKTTLYLAFVPNEKIVPQNEGTGIIGKIFTESMLPLYVILTTVTFVFFWIFGSYGPIFFVAAIVGLSIFSGKIVAKTGNWEINEKQQEIILLQYHFSLEKFEQFRKKYAKNISEIRKKIYEQTIAQGKQPDCQTSSKTFSEYGIDCTPENLTIKTINIYQIVKKAATKFGLPIPKIVIRNTIIPNAAAAGPTASLGTVLITTGILSQLEEDELLSVVGHEMSHLKNHDPVVMSSMSSLEFLVRFYVVLPIIINLGIIVFWGYFIVAIGLVYFFGKFLEGRADLDSAKVIGQPKVMAEALKKIGFRRLFPLNKREPEFTGYRRSEWLRFDPHPPAYHRIAQLENLEEPEKIKHTLLRTIKDNIKGFLRA